jgi:hypothetical protein
MHRYRSMTDETLPGYVCWWCTRASSRQRGFGAAAHAIRPTAESMWGFLLKSVLKVEKVEEDFCFGYFFFTLGVG